MDAEGSIGGRSWAPARGIVLGLFLLAWSSTALAVFHLWQINEVFSNADGTVQFIELVSDDNDQQFLTGHSLTSSQGSTSRSFVFQTDLPGSTRGRSMLIATTGFAALGLITPDYVIPNGFLFTTNGRVNFAGVDSVSWAALPLDGRSSINRAGVIALSSPTNFAGNTASVALGGTGVLGTPVDGSVVSGVGVISGYHCSSKNIEILVDGVSIGPAGAGTTLLGTQEVCGRTDTGYALLYNFNNLSNGAHTISARADGVEFDLATVTTVRSGGVPWLAGANRSFTLADFPSTGRSVTLQWVESYQNFVITAVTGE